GESIVGEPGIESDDDTRDVRGIQGTVGAVAGGIAEVADLVNGQIGGGIDLSPVEHQRSEPQDLCAAIGCREGNRGCDVEQVACPGGKQCCTTGVDRHRAVYRIAGCVDRPVC